MPNARLKYLFERHLAKTCTEAEKQELAVMILSSKHEEDIQDLLRQAWDNASGAEDMEEEKSDHIIQLILASPPTPLQKERGAIVRRLWKKIAAAAAVLLLASVGSYFIFKNKENQDIVKAEPQETRFKNDVAAPTKAKATITLADGRNVGLDSLSYGKLATQGNVNVMVTADGRLVYKELGTSTPLAMQYNTLNNPRGSKAVDMTLVDGTRVWLNAGSSVTYPVAFIGNERKVSMTGEAYFEVKHNAAMPFRVTKGLMELTDLGTRFNVKAFDDEAEIKVTLLEGSVAVQHTSQFNNSAILKPGEQALVTTSIKIVKGVDIDEVMAWKNGTFELNGNTIEPIMREVSRWYDVDVIYEGPKPNDNFMGGTSRQGNISELLKILELTKAVRFKIDGRKVTVMKY